MTLGKRTKRSRVTRSVKIWINGSKEEEIRRGKGAVSSVFY